MESFSCYPDLEKNQSLRMFMSPMILPVTALSHMNFILRNLDVEYPVVEIEHEKDEYYVNPIYSSADGRLVERAYSFVSE